MVRWRRNASVLGGGAVVAAAVLAVALSSPTEQSALAVPRPAGTGATPTATATATPTATPTGTPVGTPTASATPLAAGETPPQFVVVSFDGAGNLDAWQYWRDVADRTGARFTFFLTGTYLLPESKAALYTPPGRPAGASEVGFSTAADIRARMEHVRRAYLAGHEIGTHFNGHFCGPRGVNRWSAADWEHEFDQFDTFLSDWRTNADALDAEPLPFGPEAVVGERTPCLEGDRDALLPVLAARGFRYDTSGYGSLRWPVRRANGLWDVPMQELRLAGTKRAVLSMDYNLWEAQSGARRAPDAKLAGLREQALATYREAYAALEQGNRAPLVIGNHFARWNDGIYAEALAAFLAETCGRPGTRCVSFRELLDWLEAQPESTRAELASRAPQEP